MDIRLRIYGSILASESIHGELRNWREFFKSTQSELAKEMGVSPSVVSDYETGRQGNPGTRFLKRYVEALIRLDEKKGDRGIRLIASEGFKSGRGAILDIYEYGRPTRAKEVAEATNSEILVNEELLDFSLFGHTVLDSIATILSLSGDAFYRVYGSSTERALIFTKVSMGRSPMVAIRVYPLKPRMVVLHGPSNVDELAKKIAEREKVILALSRKPSVPDLIEGLAILKE
jgi:putative transcriptional regulator